MHHFSDSLEFLCLVVLICAKVLALFSPLLTSCTIRAIQRKLQNLTFADNKFNLIRNGTLLIYTFIDLFNWFFFWSGTEKYIGGRVFRLQWQNSRHLQSLFGGPTSTTAASLVQFASAIRELSKATWWVLPNLSPMAESARVFAIYILWTFSHAMLKG